MRRYLQHGLKAGLITALATAGLTLAPQAPSAVAEAAPTGAVLTFEADGLDTGDPRFVNEVLLGGQVVAPLPAADDFGTVEIPLPSTMLSSGETEVVIASTPAVAGGPVDTFFVRDVRMVLPNGTVVRDRDHEGAKTYEITGEVGDTKIAGPGKYNPRRRFLFWLPRPSTTSGQSARGRVVTAVAGSADAKPLREDDEGVAQQIALPKLASLRRADGNRIATKVANGFAYQQYDVAVADGGPHVDITWRGRSADSAGASLFGFDHHLGRWVEVAAGDRRRQRRDIKLTATVDRDSFVRERVVRLLVMQRQFRADDAEVTVAWVTDSQFQTQANLRPLDLPGQIADWLVGNHERLGIDYMAYTGDLVENGGADPSEFTYMSEALQPLDDIGFPYGVVPGNHDYLGFGLPCIANQLGGVDVCSVVNPFNEASETLGADPRLALYGEYFGANRFQGRPWYGEQFRNNENHYDIVELGGRRIAFLYMGWDAQPEEFAWARAALEGPLADLPVVFAAHEYLNLGETMAQKGTAILEELVLPHDNVFAIISGHYHGVAYQVRRTDDGRLVLELLHDYQDETEAGAAYFRLLHFDLDDQQLRSTEYSPHHDDFLIEGFDVRRQEYTVPLHLDDIDRRIVTDVLRVTAAP